MRTPCLPNSPAADSVKPRTANLLAAYAALPGCPKSADVLATLTIDPPGREIYASWAFMQFITPVTFTASVVSQSCCDYISVAFSSLLLLILQREMSGVVLA
jgi:hypothetical protein